MVFRLLRNSDATLPLVSRRSVIPCGIIPTLAFLLIGAADPTPEGIEFFEAKIRPVLVKSCFSCHSNEAKSLKAGLRLDSAPAMRQGGDGGPAVVPGNVEESLLISALRYESSQMPPSGKLPEETIADFTKWVEMGAPDPRATAPAAPTSNHKRVDLAAARQFWSFQPPQTHATADVKDRGWAHTSIDRHIIAALESKGLKPVRAAGKRELIRRATFDLTGLPPTPEEIEAFLADDKPDAFDRVVERLLASPHYGERWGRYWLDVARYAEDQAHTFATVPNTSGYRYRDWVVQAFNSDLPYDRFVKLQVAGDQLPEGLNPPYEGRIALGFFGLGAQYYKNSDAAKAAADELDDRVDTLTRGFLGLTVSCARCHDHKFDPIPTQDYYSLAGIFQSSKLANTPLVPDDEVNRFQQEQEKLKAAENELKMFRENEKAKIVEANLERLDAYLLAARSLLASGKASPGAARNEGLDPVFLERWAKLLRSKNETARRLETLDSWRAFASLATPDKAEEGQGTTASLAAAAQGVRDEVRRLSARRVVTKSEPFVDLDLDIAGAKRLYLVVADGGDGQSCDWADWIEPKLIGPAGEKKLTELPWKSASSGFGTVQVGKNVGGGPLRVAGYTPTYGIGTHAPSVIIFDLPAGYTRFKSRAGLDNGGTDQAGGEGATVQFLATTRKPETLSGCLLYTSDQAGGEGATVQFLATTRKPETLSGVLGVDGAVDGPKAELLKVLFGEKGVFAIADADLIKTFQGDLVSRNQGLTAKVEQLQTSTRQPYPIAHSLVEAATADMHVFVRGNPAQQGELAPRRFLRILAGDNPARFTKGSGRLELAEAIASPDNPLTARVMVNRIWQNHFGRGLVGTSSNFGTLGERPSHPEILDELAKLFVTSGWSIKTIHREIMRSATYQLSTDFDEHNFQVDADNRLLWRANRRRLDVESWRDAFLAVSGRLDATVGGPSLLLSDPANHRRTLYAKISRHDLDSLLRLFDFPDPNITSDKRNQTTVPQQQLFVLNSPFVVEQAKALTRRLQADVGPKGDDVARIRRAYFLLYGRPVEDDETAMGLAYLAASDEPGDPSAPRVTRWDRYAQVLLSSNEFLYLD